LKKKLGDIKDWIKNVGLKPNLQLKIARYKLSIVLLMSMLFLSFNIANANSICKEGCFKKIYKNISINNSVPIKLKDGRLFLKNNENYSVIFNPLNNSFSKAAKLNKYYDYQYDDGFALNDGRLLFIGPYMKLPEAKFETKFYTLVSDDLENEQKKIYRKKEYEYVSDETYNFIIASRALDYWSNLSYKEKEKLWKPKIHNNPELLKEYNDYVAGYYDKSMFAQIYDPKTDKFSYFGKTKVRRSSASMVQLKNGKVFIIGGRHFPYPIKNEPIENAYIKYINMIEFYDPATGKFESFKIDKGFRDINDILLLNDGRVLIICRLINKGSYFYTYYNPEDNTFSEIKNFELAFSNYLNLRNGNILLFVRGKSYSTRLLDLYIFNPYTEEYKYVGNMAVPRGDTFSYVELKDGRILILGGVKTEARGIWDDEVIPQMRAEIFDIKAGKSKLIGKTNYEHFHAKSVLLDNGSVLVMDVYPELYVPNKNNKAK